MTKTSLVKTIYRFLDLSLINSDYFEEVYTEYVVATASQEEKTVIRTLFFFFFKRKGVCKAQTFTSPS